MTALPHPNSLAALGHVGRGTRLAEGETSDFLQVNDFGQHTNWLHPAAVAFANYGIVLFAVLLLAGWWLARRNQSIRVLARALLAPVGMLLALAANQRVVHAGNKPRP